MLKIISSAIGINDQVLNIEEDFTPTNLALFIYALVDVEKSFSKFKI